MQKPRIRIGHSFDIHQTVCPSSRPLTLGGVIIPYTKSLKGHSDADCVIHAIIEALLGAAGLRSIGYYFPDTSSTYKNIDSLTLLEKTLKLINEQHFLIGNIDVMIYAQQPRLEEFIPEMQKLLTQYLVIPLNDLSIKVTTFEKLGPIGNEEAIAASAVALLYY